MFLKTTPGKIVMAVAVGLLAMVAWKKFGNRKKRY